MKGIETAGNTESGLTPYQEAYNKKTALLGQIDIRTKQIRDTEERLAGTEHIDTAQIQSEIEELSEQLERVQAELGGLEKGKEDQ